MRIKLSRLAVLLAYVAAAVVVATADGPTPNAVSASAPGEMFITRAELMDKPMSGAGWTLLKSKADMASYGVVDLGDQDSLTQSYVLAGALVYARTGVEAYRIKVVAAVRRACGTEANGPDSLLALARTLYGYVVAADLVRMPQSTTCTNGQTWRAFLERVRTEVIPGHPRWKTLEFTSANTSSNWGAYALSSHLAVSYALGDTAAIQRDLNIFKRFLGDVTSPAAPFAPSANYGFNGNGTTWDMTRVLQRGINPYSATDPRQGALIEDVLRLSSGGNDSVRCCTVQPAAITYQEETLDGVLSTVQLFRAHGIDLRSFQHNAIYRAFQFFISHGGPGPYTLTRYIPYAINYLYRTTHATRTEDRPFRHLGYGSWLFTMAPSPVLTWDRDTGSFAARTMSNWTFQMRSNVTYHRRYDTVVLGDLDRDSVSDELFLWDRDGGAYAVLTMVNYVPKSGSAGAFPLGYDEAIVGDYDADGRVNDIFFWDQATGRFRIYSFSALAPTLRATGTWSAAFDYFVAGDWDDDGRFDDVMVWNRDGRQWEMRSFAAFSSVVRSSGTWPAGYDRAYNGDWNNDLRRDDLILWDDATGRVVVYTWSTNGQPTYASTSTFSSTLDLATAADLDGNRRWNEMLVFDRQARAWQVYRWQSYTPTLARAGTWDVSYDVVLG